MAKRRKPKRSTARSAIGDNIAAGIVADMGVDPAKTREIMQNVAGITADVKTITGALATIVKNLESRFAPPSP